MNKKLFNVCLLAVAIVAFVLFGFAMANADFLNGWILPTVLFLGSGILFLVRAALQKSVPAHLIGSTLFALGGLSLALMLTLMWYWCIIIFVVAFLLAGVVRNLAGIRKWDQGDNQK